MVCYITIKNIKKRQKGSPRQIIMEKVKKFTDAMVRNIKPCEQRIEYTEGNGFILRVSPSGVKTWVYYFKFDKKPQRLTLGRHPALSVAQARKALTDAALLKDNGINPIQHKKDQEAKAKAKKQREIQTVEWLVNDFYQRYILKNRKAPEQIRQQKEADIIPLLGDMKIQDISTRDITKALETIVDRGSPIHANKVLRTIKQMFNYAVSKGLLKYNPAIAIDAKTIGGIETPRDRYLSYDEIKALWSYLDDTEKHRTHPATILGLKILLLTGVRTGSLIKAEWQEVDFNACLWTIPPEHLKLKKSEARKPHKVHLTDFVKGLFMQLRDLTDSQYIIPHKDGDKPANSKLFSRVINRSRGNIEGITENFNVHDFRTTFSTSLAELGISPHITELALGHKLPKIMATYNKFEYLDERKEALTIWSDKIEMLVNNTNVVLLNPQTN